jgi:hypothetical protein
MTGDETLAESVQLVSHDVRADIVVALAEHQREAAPGEALGFAALRRRVGHDDPGNFNYHLGQLRGNLVTGTEEGYRLSTVGQHYVALLVSGRFDPDESRELPDVETACPVCGKSSSVAYEGGMLRTACPDGHTSRLNVGPELLDEWSVEETLTIALRRNLFEAKSVVEGICPYCEGSTAGGFERVDGDAIPVQYEAQCERCGMVVSNTAGGCVLFHPAVVAFCYQHGIDVYRDAWKVMTSHIETVTVDEEEPLRVGVELVVDDNSLVVTLDRSAAVTNVEGV